MIGKIVLTMLVKTQLLCYLLTFLERRQLEPKFAFWSEFASELELIQTQMTQKPMLRAEVYARALRASQNRKEDSV